MDISSTLRKVSAVAFQVANRTQLSMPEEGLILVALQASRAAISAFLPSVQENGVQKVSSYAGNNSRNGIIGLQVVGKRTSFMS